MKKTEILILLLAAVTLIDKPTSAAVVYTDLVPDSVITNPGNPWSTGRGPLDINNDGVTDFNFEFDGWSSGWYIHATAPAGTNNELFAAPMPPNNAKVVLFPAGTVIQAVPMPQGAGKRVAAQAAHC